MEIRKVLSRIPGIRSTYQVIYYLGEDFRAGRVRTVTFGLLAGLLPDLLACGFVRSHLWRLAGAKLTECWSSVIRSGVFIEHPTGLTAGRNFQVNRNAYLDATGGLDIGENVTISLNCKILSMSHAGERHQRDVLAKTVIGDNVIVYAGATVLPGSVIERYVVIAAGAVVRGNTVSGGIYAGVPAVLKGIRNDVCLPINPDR